VFEWPLPPPTAPRDVLTSAALDIQNLVARKSGVKCATLQAANKLVWAEQSLDASNTKQLNALNKACTVIRHVTEPDLDKLKKAVDAIDFSGSSSTLTSPSSPPTTRTSSSPPSPSCATQTPDSFGAFFIGDQHTSAGTQTDFAFATEDSGDTTISDHSMLGDKHLEEQTCDNHREVLPRGGAFITATPASSTVAPARRFVCVGGGFINGKFVPGNSTT